MATYVNDLRLKEISTGDESGTWGTSTNTNLELIGEALGYATEQSFGSDADATTTVADGVSDPARAMYFKVTSAVSLTATRTLTIAPNTVSRVMFIENATSGSQSIAISQGSGANVTIATGKTAIVYLDGAGAGAAVVDAMAGVDPGVTDTLAEVLTAGNATGGTSMVISSGDDVTFTGASANIVFDSSDSALEFGDNAKAVFGAGSDLQIYHDGSNSYVNDVGTGDLILKTAGAGVQMWGGGDVMFNAVKDGGVSLYYDNAAKLATTSTGIDVTGTATMDGLTTSGNILLDGSGNPTVINKTSGAGNNPVYRLQADTNYWDLQGTFSNTNDELFFMYNGSTKMAITSAGNVGIGTSSPTDTLSVGTLGSGSNSIITIGASTTGTSSIYFGDGASAARFRGYFDYVHSSDSLAIGTAAAERMRIDSSGNVGIGTSSPSTLGGGAKLTVNQAADGNIVFARGGSTRQVQLGTTSTTGYINADNTSSGLTFNVNASPRMLIDSSGNVGIGTNSPSHLLELVRSSTDFGPTLEINNTSSANGSTASVRFVTESESTGFVMGKHASGFGQADLAFINQELNSDLAIFTNNTERMRIDSSGHITSLPTYNNGSASSANVVVNSSGLFLRSVSSAKYKTNIEDVQDAYVDSLLNIRPVYYRSTLENDNPEHSHWGFIAEEVAEIDPRLVHYKTVDITYSDDGEPVETKLETPEPEGVQYERFAPLMLKLIQKQQATITALEARITQLEND